MSDDTQLVDPLTREPLARATDEELDAIREAIESGRARRADAGEVPTFEGAYLTTDGKHAYLIIGGIPNFVVEERVVLG